jgi:hypothetical protein
VQGKLQTIYDWRSSKQNPITRLTRGTISFLASGEGVVMRAHYPWLLRGHRLFRVEGGATDEAQEPSEAMMMSACGVYWFIAPVAASTPSPITPPATTFPAVIPSIFDARTPVPSL